MAHQFERPLAAEMDKSRGLRRPRRSLSLRMESGSAGGYLASEPVLLVVRCDTRYLRFPQEADDGRLSGWVYGRCALRLNPRRAILSGSDTRSVYGRTDVTRSAP